MKFIITCLIFILTSQIGISQENQLTIRGNIIDAKTKVPLSNATVEVKSHSIEMISGLDGEFEFRIPSDAKNDTLEISHIGFKSVKKKIAEIKNSETFFLEDYSIELRAITITSRTLNMKEIDNALRVIRGNLYAYETETTNGLYNLFLNFLEEHGQTELLKQCDFDLSVYDEKDKTFYKAYSAINKGPVNNKKDTSKENYTGFPAVNISHGAALIFCKWLTEQYNGNNGKKKFTKVLFRLPTLKEWQIAALGNKNFQSWNLDENTVEVVIPLDTLTGLTTKGKKITLQVKQEILYPWWSAYNYRKKAANHKNCYLGNFNVSAETANVSAPCAWGPLPNYDGWYRMARTASYFPNNIGLYDVVGNVAEMIDEKGKACGGSWNDLPLESTIHSIKSYKKPDASIGFRIFMEVVAE